MSPDDFRFHDAPAWQGPPWLQGALAWIDRHRPALLAGAVSLQLVVLLAMIGLLAAPLVLGDTILLRTEPVDPRDLFRGDYVALRYEIGRLPPEGVPGLNVDPRWYRRRRDASQEQTVYVSLVPEADGRHWRAAGVSLTRPAEGKYIQGTYHDWGGGQITFGIESFYVPEGTGLKYEEAQRRHRVSAEVALTGWGRAALRDLKIAPEKPPLEAR